MNESTKSNDENLGGNAKGQAFLSLVAPIDLSVYPRERAAKIKCGRRLGRKLLTWNFSTASNAPVEPREFSERHSRLSGKCVNN